MDLAPAKVSYCTGFYLDLVGVLTSIANRLFLKQSYPTENQILLWDRLFVPVSRVADKAVAHTFGRSVVAVWKAAATRES